MDIYCPACQKKLQIADSSAGQTVKCPSCAANFQAPSLPAVGPLPTIEPLVPPAISKPEYLQPAQAPSQAEPSKSQGECTHGITIKLRREIVTLIPPIGMAILIFLSFFPWRHWGSTTINLWELAFTEAGLGVFLYYVLLLIVATPVTFLPPLLERNLLPAPASVRPFLPWLPMAGAFLNLAAWLLFAIHYFQCTFLESWDPATLGMKLAFRIHTLIVVTAFLGIWLERRKRRELQEPNIKIRW